MKTKSLLLALVCTLLCAFHVVAAEPYAVYHSSNYSLWFYYGTKPESSWNNEVYSLNPGDIYPEWNNNGHHPIIFQVVFDSSFAQARPTSTAFWFTNMVNITTITRVFNTCKGVMGVR